MTEEKVTNRDRIGKQAEMPAEADFTPPEFSTEQLLGIAKEEEPKKEAKEPAKPAEKEAKKEAKEEPEAKEAKEAPEEESDKEKEPADPAPVVKAKKTKADYIAERLAKKAEKAKAEDDPVARLADMLAKKEEKPAEVQAKQDVLPDEDDLVTDLLLKPKETIERLKEEIRQTTLQELESKFLPEVEQLKTAQQQREIAEGYKELNRVYESVTTQDTDFGDAYDSIRSRIIDTIIEQNPNYTASQVESELKVTELALMQQAAPQIDLLQRVNGVTEEEAVSAFFKNIAIQNGWTPSAQAEATAEEVKSKLSLNDKRQMKERATSLNGAGASVPSARDWAASQSAKMTNRQRVIAQRQS